MPDIYSTKIKGVLDSRASHSFSKQTCRDLFNAALQSKEAAREFLREPHRYVQNLLRSGVSEDELMSFASKFPQYTSILIHMSDINPDSSLGKKLISTSFTSRVHIDPVDAAWIEEKEKSFQASAAQPTGNAQKENSTVAPDSLAGEIYAARALLWQQAKGDLNSFQQSIENLAIKNGTTIEALLRNKDFQQLCKSSSVLAPAMQLYIKEHPIEEFSTIDLSYQQGVTPKIGPSTVAGILFGSSQTVFDATKGNIASFHAWATRETAKYRYPLADILQSNRDYLEKSKPLSILYEHMRQQSGNARDEAPRQQSSSPASDEQTDFKKMFSVRDADLRREQEIQSVKNRARRDSEQSEDLLSKFNVSEFIQQPDQILRTTKAEYINLARKMQTTDPTPSDKEKERYQDLKDLREMAEKSQNQSSPTLLEHYKTRFDHYSCEQNKARSPQGR